MNLLPRQRRVVNILRLAWTVLAFWYEYLIFKKYARSCHWPDHNTTGLVCPPTRDCKRGISNTTLPSYLAKRRWHITCTYSPRRRPSSFGSSILSRPICLLILSSPASRQSQPSEELASGDVEESWHCYFPWRYDGWWADGNVWCRVCFDIRTPQTPYTTLISPTDMKDITLVSRVFFAHKRRYHITSYPEIMTLGELLVQRFTVSTCPHLFSQNTASNRILSQCTQAVHYAFWPSER